MWAELKVDSQQLPGYFLAADAQDLNGYSLLHRQRQTLHDLKPEDAMLCTRVNESQHLKRRAGSVKCERNERQVTKHFVSPDSYVREQH